MAIFGEIDSKEVGKLASSLGAGRNKKEDTIDPSVGIVLNKKVGDKVNLGDTLGYVHANCQEKCEEVKTLLDSVIKISPNEVKKEKVILEIIK